jgi:hypothetical protein
VTASQYAIPHAYQHTYPYSYPPVLPPCGSVPTTTGSQMKARNPLGVWLGLPLITFGVYYLVWLFKVHSELAMFDRRRVVGTVGPVLAWLLGFATLMVWPLVSTYRTGRTIAATQRAAGLPVTCSGLVGLLLVFAFGTHSLYYQIEINKIVVVNPEPTGAQVPLWE